MAVREVPSGVEQTIIGSTPVTTVIPAAPAPSNEAAEVASDYADANPVLPKGPASAGFKGINRFAPAARMGHVEELLTQLKATSLDSEAADILGQFFEKMA